jgi:hypothetical protein
MLQEYAFCVIHYVALGALLPAALLADHGPRPLHIEGLVFCHMCAWALPLLSTSHYNTAATTALLGIT